MVRDAHGLEVTAASAQAVQAFDHALAGYLGIAPTRRRAWPRCWTPIRRSAWRIA